MAVKAIFTVRSPLYIWCQDILPLIDVEFIINPYAATVYLLCPTGLQTTQSTHLECHTEVKVGFDTICNVPFPPMQILSSLNPIDPHAFKIYLHG